jgi:beta-phosphoglucomutase
MIKALIFDLDGVITDTAKYHYLAWRELALGLGFDFTEEQNEQLKGVSRIKSLEILLEIGGIIVDEDIMEQLADKKNTRYVEFISKMTPDEILPGVVDFLKKAKTEEYKIAIGSASKNAQTILNRINLNSYFDVVIDGTKVHKPKPDPEVFFKAASELNVKPEECIVFEDAEAGIEAAVNGGFHSVGVGNSKSLGSADYTISGFENVLIEDLIKLIE